MGKGNLIRENIQFLKKKVSMYEGLIKDWQADCPHEIVEGEYKGSTGNWCPDDDSYWIDATCLDCGKSLLANSGTELYDKLSKSGMIWSKYDSREKIESQVKLRLKIEQERNNEH